MGISLDHFNTIRFLTTTIQDPGGLLFSRLNDSGANLKPFLLTRCSPGSYRQELSHDGGEKESFSERGMETTPGLDKIIFSKEVTEVPGGP
jgi:hypothetical protein